MGTTIKTIENTQLKLIIAIAIFLIALGYLYIKRKKAYPKNEK